MHLTARDWSDLRRAAIVLIAYIVVNWLIVRYLRRKAASRTRVVEPWIISFVIWLFALAPILSRRGLPRWLSIIVLVAIIFTGLLPVFRRAQRDWASAALQRAYGISGGEEPEMLISKEEKKLTLYLILASVAAIGVTAAALIFSLTMWARQGAGHPVETGKLAVAIGAAVFTFLASAYARFGRWPGTVTCRAAIDVTAAPDEVWDAVALRNDYPGWKTIYTSIERLDGPAEAYRIHRADDTRCSQCLRPRQPDRPQRSIRVEVLEAQRPSLYRLRSFLEGGELSQGDNFRRWVDHEEATYQIQRLAGGGSRISYSETAFRPKAWLAIISLVGSPAKENLRSLKAHLEGTPDETLFGIATKRIEVARNAPQHCNCSA